MSKNIGKIKKSLRQAPKTLRLIDLPCLCGLAEYREVLRLTSPYILIECQGCGLRRTYPPLEGTTTSQSQGFTSRDWDKLDGRKRQLAQIGLRLIREFVSCGTILDIGCGAGRLPKAAAENGFRAVGLDREASWLQGSRVLTPFHPVVGDAHELPFQNEMFDAINMNHVLEHLEDPLKFLRESHRVLKTNGFLFIGVPNHEGLIPRLTLNWVGYVPWIHRWHFSPRSLKELLQITGFCIIRLQLRSVDTPEIESRLKKTAYQLLNFIQRQIGMGDNLIVVAQHVVGEEKSRGLELKC
jgi:SAM-dependent methyltransferase